MSMEKRQFFRFATCVPVKFFNAFAPGQGYSGMVTNISAGGARLFLKGDCQNLNYVVMNMHLPNGVLLDLVNARVIYNGKEGDGTRLGVMFMNMDIKKLSILVDFLSDLELQEKKAPEQSGNENPST